MNQRARRYCLGVAMACLASTGCKGSGGTKEPVPETVPAQRAAQSFVHCVETEGGACVTNYEEFGYWDAFSMLGWLASGSPTSILEALPRELSHHASERSIQARFVRQAESKSMLLRGAECKPDSATAFKDLTPKLSSAVRQRLTDMGLWGSDLETVVGALVREVDEGLGEGYLVGMRCQSEPYYLYVATTRRDARFIVVGLMPELPEFLGGTGAARDANTGRLRSVSLGRNMASISDRSVETVHPWIQIPVQEF